MDGRIYNLMRESLIQSSRNKFVVLLLYIMNFNLTVGDLFIFYGLRNTKVHRAKCIIVLNTSKTYHYNVFYPEGIFRS